MVLGSLLRRIVHEEDEYDSDDCLGDEGVRS